MSEGPYVTIYATVDTAQLRKGVADAQATLITKGGLSAEEADARLREWATALGEEGAGSRDAE
ncbi:hypothetical protein [Streptomyces sp. SBT349]|uniref:hypothetical protein n=1 Tax=Streptomyces sp. SBT349 TaxID=1580539 RepID=UPI00066C0817|nr:hypothetical protein [Streptomyces sp. SBT349]